MKWLTRHFGLKLVSVLLSVLLWLVVQSQSPLMDRGLFTFKLVPRNVPAEVIVTKMPETVSIEAEGTREEIAKLKRLTDKLTATVDLSEAVSGVGEYRVQRIDPSDVSVKWGRVDPVIVSLDALVRVQKPVEVEAYNAPDGLEFTDATVQPETVIIEGPESQINDVSKVRAQVDLGRSAFRAGATFSVNVEVLGESKLLPLITVSPGTVIVRPVLSPSVARKNVLVSPNWSGQPGQGFRVVGATVRPTSVELRGETQALKEIQSVATAPIDIGGVTSSRTVTVRVIVPRGVRAEPQSVSVRIEIEAIPQPPVTTTEPPPNP